MYEAEVEKFQQVKGKFTEELQQIEDMMEPVKERADTMHTKREKVI